MKIAVFAYDFPHIKSQEFLLSLIVRGITIDCVLAAPKIKLKNSGTKKRIKVKRKAIFSPKEICERFNIPYYVCAHNSDIAEKILKDREIDIGVIAGARILSENIIDSVNIGILNLHPGIIPQVRGLDALKWAVYEGHDVGVTAHFIDKRVDAGRLLAKQNVNIEEDDTFFDLSQKLEDAEIDLMLKTLKRIEAGDISEKTIITSGPCNTSMDNLREAELDDRLKIYLKARQEKK